MAIYLSDEFGPTRDWTSWLREKNENTQRCLLTALRLLPSQNLDRKSEEYFYQIINAFYYSLLISEFCDGNVPGGATSTDLFRTAEQKVLEEVIRGGAIWTET